MTTLIHSAAESQLTGLKTGLLTGPLEENVLPHIYDNIFKDDYDFVGAQLPADSGQLLATLQAYCVPFSVGGTYQTVHLKATDYTIDIQAEETITGYTPQLYWSLLKQISELKYLQTRRGMHHSVYAHMVSPTRHQESLVNTLENQAAGSGQPVELGQILLKGDQILGAIFSSAHASQGFYSHTLLWRDGITQPQWKTLVRSVQRQAFELRVPEVIIPLPPHLDVRELVQPELPKVSAYVDVLLYPLFSATSSEPVEQMLSARSTRSLLERTPSLRVGSKTSHRRLLRSLVGISAYRVIQTVPIDDDSQRITLTRVYEPESHLVAYMYHHFAKLK
jgi:hypothetical protein